MLRLPSGGSAELALGGPAAEPLLRKLDRDVEPARPRTRGFAVGGGGAISVPAAEPGLALDVPRLRGAPARRGRSDGQPRRGLTLVGR